MTYRVLLKTFILYQCKTKNVPKLNRRQFMVKLVEELTGDFRPGWTKPGRKSVKYPPGRLLYPEKHLKQTKLPIGKKRNCVICTDLKKGKRVRAFFICEHCEPFVLDNVGKIITQREFCDNSASNKCYLLCI